MESFNNEPSKLQGWNIETLELFNIEILEMFELEFVETLKSWALEADT